MKSKEELIEVVANAMEEVGIVDPGYGEVYPFNGYEELAEAALEALCRALPDMYPNIPPELLKGSVPMENRLPDIYYNQLKQYGENKNENK